jgi:hypothetical protein
MMLPDARKRKQSVWPVNDLILIVYPVCGIVPFGVESGLVLGLGL